MVLALLGVDRLPKGMSVNPFPKLNGLESKYADQIRFMVRTCVVSDWMAAPVRLHLANRTTYTPDFVFRDAGGGTIHCIEIKGFLRDDAAVKFKIAREMFPWMDFKMLKLVKGSWVEVLSGSGRRWCDRRDASFYESGK
jgi:hypothetical protein